MRWPLALFSAMLLLSPSAFAIDGGETTLMANGEETPGPTANSGCDYSELAKSLGFTESGGKYTITNPWNYLGKYQFGEARLNAIGWFDDPQKVDPGKCTSASQCEVKCGPNQNGYSACYNEFSGSWTGEAWTKYNIKSYQDYLNNGPAQERAFQLHMAKAYQETKGCHNAIGRTITDRKGRTCVVSMSGILAGAHLAGAGGVCSYLNKGGGAADNATHVSDYICTHKNIPVPLDGGQCAADNGDGRSPPDPGSQPGTDPEFHGIGAAGPTVGHYEMVDDLIRYVWIAGLQLMAEQLTNTMMAQVQIIGSFFDAKHQLETQRLMQQKAAQAQKDYHPSEQMCTFGTFARNLADTERRAQLSQAALSQRGLQRDTVSGEGISISGDYSDRMSRFNTFREKFCNKKDNAGGNADVCEGTPSPDMVNRDIDFTRTVDMPLTLAFDPLEKTASDDETALYALMDNLFQNEQTPAVNKNTAMRSDFVNPYQDLRSVIAMRAVARNSMNNIIAQKGYGPKDENGASNAAYLRALIKEMGITNDEEITHLLGERPSYWAQMELLTKKIYQHPDFIVNLYDKPANVARMRASMRAIKVMQDRDIQEALARREMLISLLAELSVRRQQERINIEIRNLPSVQRQ